MLAPENLARILGAARSVALVSGLVLTACLGGCGLPAGAGGVGTVTTGKGSRQYAYARARVPVTLEGKVSNARRGYVHTVTLTMGTPKYTLDPAISVRISETTSDKYQASIDERFLLTSVVPLGASGAAIPPPANPVGLDDFPASLMRALPSTPRQASLQHTLPEKLPPFRLEKEIDPAAPEEIQAFQDEITRVARAWGLDIAFNALGLETTIAGKPVMLAKSSGTPCRMQICFRIPIPYRLSVTPNSTGWHGNAGIDVWLANDGPIASIDVRDSTFVSGNVRAEFENGMLKSLTGGQPGVAEALLRLPPEIVPTGSITH